MELKDKIQEFVDFVDDPPAKNREAIFLRLTDQILVAAENTPDLSDEKDYSDSPKRDYKIKRETVSSTFRNYGFYNIPEKVCSDISNVEILVGDSIDDIVDLYHDFSDFLWRCENTSEENAVWYFKNPDHLHWENHLRGLQYYLFHKLEEDK